MFPEGEKFLWEGMVFLAFALVCGALVERRFCCAPSARCRERARRYRRMLPRWLGAIRRFPRRCPWWKTMARARG